MTLTLDSGHTAYGVVHHSSTSIPTCLISLKSKKLFVDERTDERTDPLYYVESEDLKRVKYSRDAVAGAITISIDPMAAKRHAAAA